jgi:hypothetical protein
MGTQNPMLYRSLHFLTDYLPPNHDNDLRVSFPCWRIKFEPNAGRGLGFSQWQITECHRLAMSAVTPEEDIARVGGYVRFVPETDSCTAANCSLFDYYIGACEQALINQF